MITFNALKQAQCPHPVDRMAAITEPITNSLGDIIGQRWASDRCLDCGQTFATEELWQRGPV